MNQRVTAQTNFMTPEDYQRLIERGQAERDQAAAAAQQPMRHWTQALASVLGQGFGQVRMEQAERAKQQATEGQNAALAAVLRNEPGAVESAMKFQGIVPQVLEWKANAPQREHQQWKMANERETAPLEMEALQAQIAARRAQTAAASRPPQPKWMKVGRDSLGQDIFGWVDPATRQVIPQTLPGVAPARTPNQGEAEPGAPGASFSLGEPPPGVDPAEYRKYASRAAANAVVAARQAYPGVRAAVDRTTAVIDGLLNNPAWERSTGVISGLLPSVSEDAANFDQLLEQARGGAFVQAFQDIKGGGAITETEGRAATQALARLQSSRVGSANFKKALQDFKNELVKLQKIAAWKAGFRMDEEQGQASPQNNAPERRKFNPATGRIE